MNWPLGILGLTVFAISLTSSVVAQEQSSVVQAVPNWSDAVNCSALRTPGIAETSDQYNAHIPVQCQTKENEAVEATLAIREAGITYREFLKLDAH